MLEKESLKVSRSIRKYKHTSLLTSSRNKTVESVQQATICCVNYDTAAYCPPLLDFYENLPLSSGDAQEGQRMPGCDKHRCTSNKTKSLQEKIQLAH